MGSGQAPRWHRPGTRCLELRTATAHSSTDLLSSPFCPTTSVGKSVSLIVQKFGGTSVADADRIRAAAARAVAAQRDGDQVVMVVSARGKKTDELVALAAEITDAPSAREMDMLLSTGEQESVALMAMAIGDLGGQAISLTGSQIGIVTDSAHTQARIREISTDRMREALSGDRIVIAAGFQGIDEAFNITTLGRGGSDTTATALAAVLGADLCEIYTDVEGVFTTDPRIVSSARRISSMSYDEMLELASLGAGVMHARSIEFAKKYQVPVRVRPSKGDGEGTLIVSDPGPPPPLVTSVALVRDEARVSLSELPDRPGVMSLLFARLARRKTPIDMIVQDVGADGIAEVSFTVPERDLDGALAAAGEAVAELGQGNVRHATNAAKVSAVGRGMRTHSGVAAQMFSALGDVGVNIGMITTSEIKISVLVDRDHGDQALETVHSGFALHEESSEQTSVGHRQPPRDRQPAGDREQLEREIVSRLASMEDIVVSDVELDTEQSLLTIRHLPDQPGIAAAIFSAVAEGGILVDMIVQNIPEDVGAAPAHLSFTVTRRDLDSCLLLVREVLERWSGAEPSFDREIAMLSVIGIGLRSHTGVGVRMFAALSDAGINIRLINTSEIRVSVVVDLDRAEEAHEALLGAFELGG